MCRGRAADVPATDERIPNDVNDVPTEMAARNDLHRALLALEDRPGYGQATDEEVRQLELSALALGDEELVWRSRLLSAELSGRRGELAHAARLLWQAKEFAAAHGHIRMLARSHLFLSWTYRDIGDLATYLEHAIRAVELLDAETPGAVRALYLIRLADALDECGSPQEARLRYIQAEEIAVREGNIPRLVTCLNNRAYGEYLAGDLERAEATIDRLVAICQHHKVPMRHNTLDTMAHIQIALGRYEEAIKTVHQAIAAYRAQAVLEAMSPAEFLLTLALAQRKSGALDAAQGSLAECRALGAAGGFASVLARVDEEQAELHAVRGHFENAFQSFKAFHAAEKQLISEQRAAQSNLRQAMLDMQQLRTEADRLREEAHRDPLTGLYNRRFVDATLPALLKGRTPKQVVAVALVDLDNFKRVNDTCSHAAGDEVLVKVAALLAEAATVTQGLAAGCFAARMGGEEFLVVLTDLSRERSLQSLEDLRSSVAGSDWRPITGELPVTISVGLCWARVADTQSSVLRRSDELLYLAKNAGRNRVCVSDADIPG